MGLPQRLLAVVVTVCIGVCLAAFWHGSGVVPSGTNYYFANAGSDSNNCTSTGTPCQTIGKLNGITYPANSTINLNGGDTFTDAPINLSNASVSSVFGAITIQSYGTGNAIVNPSSNGGLPYVANFSDLSNFTTQHINVVLSAAANFTGGITFTCFNDVTCSNVNIIANDVTGIGTNSGSASPAGCISPSSSTTSYNCGAIYISGYTDNPSFTFSNVNVTNNVVHDLWGNSGHTMDFDCGICLNEYAPQVMTGVTVSGNTIHDVGGGTAGAILIQGLSGATIQDNLIYNVGANTHSCGSFSGIELYAGEPEITATSAIVTQFNEAYNVSALPPALTTDCDEVAFDFDRDVSNSIAQYNYFHDNAGPGIETAYDGSGNVVRYNVLINNMRGVVGTYIANGGSGYPGSSVNLFTTGCSMAQAEFVASVSGGVVQEITSQVSPGNGCPDSASEATTCASCGGSGATLYMTAYIPGGGTYGAYWKIIISESEIHNGSSPGVSEGIPIVYNNTIIGPQNQNGFSSPPYTFAFYYGNFTGGAYFNNIAYESCFWTSNVGGTSGYSYFLNEALAELPPIMDHNDYYSSCAGPGVWGIGSTTYTSLAALTSATGYEAHSITSNPSLTNTSTSPTCGSTSGPQPCPTNAELTGSPPVAAVGANPYFPPFSGLIAATGASPATQDYYGNTLSSSVGVLHGMGADEASGTSSLSPSVSVTAPSAGTISGTSVTLTATASESGGVIQAVQFYVDGNPVSAPGTELSTSPYTTTFTSYSVLDGSHTITAKAWDTAGNVTTSSGVSVTVSNGSGASCLASNEWIGRSGVTGSLKTVEDTMICGMVSDGDWSHLDALYFFPAPTQAMANLNLVSDAYGNGIHPLVVAGTMTFTANSNYVSDGTSGYLNTGIVNGNGPNISQNSATIGAYILNNRNTGSANLCELGNDDSYIAPEATVGWHARVNTYAYGEISGTFPTTSQGQWFVQRTSALAMATYRNGTLLGSSSMDPSQTTDFPFIISACGFGVGDTPSNFSTDEEAVSLIGDGVLSTSRVASRINTAMTSLGLNVY